MKDVKTIGLIGAGHIGSQLARLAVKNGYQVVISNSRGPETLSTLVAELGPKARAATAAEAAKAGDIVVVTVPLKKPGAYQLRMSLRDTATERIGSASQFIDAPDIKKNRVAISGIVLRGESRGTPATTTPTPGGGNR